LRSVQRHSKTAGPQRSTLQPIITQLRGHLNERHGIAEVCPS
jgi:hypothetical protein